MIVGAGLRLAYEVTLPTNLCPICLHVRMDVDMQLTANKESVHVCMYAGVDEHMDGWTAGWMHPSYALTQRNKAHRDFPHTISGQHSLAYMLDTSQLRIYMHM